MRFLICTFSLSLYIRKSNITKAISTRFYTCSFFQGYHQFVRFKIDAVTCLYHLGAQATYMEQMHSVREELCVFACTVGGLH